MKDDIGLYWFIINIMVWCDKCNIRKILTTAQNSFRMSSADG